jgi:hypothetical protein
MILGIFLLADMKASLTFSIEDKVEGAPSLWLPGLLLWIIFQLMWNS